MMEALFKKAQNEFSAPPIWLMRQAGRYLPEYKKVRKSVSSFLDLCYHPKKAAEVTLQPLRRFNLDAAIIFSDILVLPDVLGIKVDFIENIGPILETIKSPDDFTKLKKKLINTEKLASVYEAIALVKSQLPKDKSLIGFVGAPWTVMSYMFEGRGKQNSFEISKSFLYNYPETSEEISDYITTHTINHLKSQIKAGATIIKVFDSWAGMLSEEEFDKYVINPTKKITTALKSSYPDVPIIGFPKGAGFLYEKYIESTGIDIIAVDQFIPFTQINNWQKKMVVQGNLDPLILLTNKKTIQKKLDKLLGNISKQNYIFNLGHGVLQNTPVENVEFLVNYINGK